MTTLKQVENVSSEPELFLDIGFEAATSEGLAFAIFSDSICLSEDHRAVANIHIFPCNKVSTFKLEDVTRLTTSEAPARPSCESLRPPTEAEIKAITELSSKVYSQFETKTEVDY